jgi:protein tyrosine phosphatase domain-containing protein 1
MNIGMIVNLQREGEHPYCGDKLDINSGFSYDPQKLISEDIKYRNFGWEDMSIPDSMGFMINIMKDMLVTIQEEKKKVLVHCHAGYGRTGIVIACYMITVSNKSAEEIVAEIRSKRPKCIQKSAQMDYCKKFRECNSLLKISY